MSGWIKIHRSIVNHWLYTEKRTFSKFEAWHDILIMVNFVECKTMIKGKVYTIKRGESILSLESWSKRWNWDKSKVRRFMKALQDDSMVVLQSDNITTRLSVCNYDTYQSERNADETQTKRKRHSNELQTTFKRHSNELQTTPIEEGEEEKEFKELKKDKESKELQAQIEPTIESIFEWFWNAYQKVGVKKKSFSAFKNLDKSEMIEIKNHLPKFLENHYRNNKMEFLPHFSTYINQRRWENKLPYEDKKEKINNWGV
jgi:hypothetical protein